MLLSQLTRLTLRWPQAVETGSDDALEVAEDRLVEYLVSAGNSESQIDLWLSYSAVMMAHDGETIESVMETEVIMAKMQERIR